MPTRTTEMGTETNVRNIVYRASTVCAIAVGGAGAGDLLRIPAVIEALAHLGYPTYFATILGRGNCSARWRSPRQDARG